MARAESPTELGLTLTGNHLTAWSREQGRWVARARRDVRDDPSTGSEPRLDVHDRDALAALEVELPAQPSAAGGFGQLGLRDLRFVSHADGSPVRDGGDLWLSATSAGPGFFDSGHTSLWRLSPDTLDLRHTADLFFRRPDRPGVYGDHATHVVRDGDRWLVATSTWGDFEQPTTRTSRNGPSTLRVTLASVEGSVDLLHGEHVLDTTELPLPTDGFTLGRRVGPAPGARGRPVAGRLREREPVLPVPPGAGGRPVARRPHPGGGGAGPAGHRGHHPAAGRRRAAGAGQRRAGRAPGRAARASRCSGPTWSSAARWTRRTRRTSRGRRSPAWTTAG